MHKTAKKKVLYIMGIDWNWIYQRPQIIAAYLSRDFDVTVAYPVKIWNRNTTKNVKGAPAAIQKLKLWTLPFQRKSRLIGRIADRYQRFLLKNYWQYTYIYISYPVAIEYIPYDYSGLIIYDCIDEHQQMCTNEHMRRRVEKDEKLLLQRSDAVIVSSKRLLQQKAMLCNKKMNLVRNGTDFTKIGDVKKAAVKKKYIVGYIGTIADWFDHDLICSSAQMHEELEYHLIGPCETLDQKESGKVIYDGVVEHAQLWSHVKEYDCMIMPFVVNEVVKAVDPVKLYEYIAFGKCIVSVYYEELEYFREYVYFYSTADEYEVLIRKLIKQGFLPKYNERQQNDFLEKNTWQERYKLIRQLMEQISSIDSLSGGKI